LTLEFIQFLRGFRFVVPHHQHGSDDSGKDSNDESYDLAHGASCSECKSKLRGGVGESLKGMILKLQGGVYMRVGAVKFK
jgi:hypothetical protein